MSELDDNRVLRDAVREFSGRFDQIPGQLFEDLIVCQDGYPNYENGALRLLSAEESQYGFPCGWGTLFHDRDGFLRDHAKEAEGAGFMVFESEYFEGLILGVDGGGYDFHEAHWLPLYRARGMRWHELREEA